MNRIPFEQRRAFADFVRAHLPLLRRYIQRRLRYYQDLDMMPRGDLTPDDIVDETVVAALRRFPEKHDDMGPYPWFRRAADGVLRRQAQRSATRRRHLVSLEAPVSIAEEGEPIRLQDILPDRRSVLPAKVLEYWELQQGLDRLLHRLPDDWREAFLMSAVDGYSPAEIAVLEGRSPEAVREDIRLAREFLRDAFASGAILQSLPDDYLPPSTPVSVDEVA